jgi:hypothetical protein
MAFRLIEVVVRRWIGVYPTNCQKMHRKPPTAVASEITNVEFDTDLHSTELIVRQLLNPTVSENEVAEYHGLVIHVTIPPFQLIFSHRYIDQCQDLQDAPINGRECKDLEVY